MNMHFTIVSAVYNVDRYLSQFLTSLDAQSYDHHKLHVILIDDGSTDESLQTLTAWALETDLDARVITQSNAGQAAARNHGLDLLAANDGWVTFTDPDDFLDEGYFSKIAEFIQLNPSVEMVSTHQEDYIDDGRVTQVDRHPLRYRYNGRDQLVDIDRFPRFIQLHGASAVFRISHITNQNLRFDSELRPIFEDGHFVARYLIQLPDRLVGFISSAHYYYRRRSDNSSTLQSSDRDPRRYTTVLERGYLDVLRIAARKSHVPEWLQNTIVYDLSWVFKRDASMFSPSAGLSDKTRTEFHRLLKEIRRLLDDRVIEGFRVIGWPLQQREAFLHGVPGESWHWASVYIGRLDRQQHLVQIRYRYTGDSPIEDVYVRGLRVDPHHSKTRDYVYLGRSLLHERILWVWADGDLAVHLDGEPMPLTFRWPQPSQFSIRAAEVRKARATGGWRKPARRPRFRRGEGLTSRFAEWVARSRLARRLFRDAWILMDRDTGAHDNAEHLFKYLRRRRRGVNAWFTVSAKSGDWKRLRAEGYKRLIPHGSFVWRVACLVATHIVSSQANLYVYEPFSRRHGKWDWKFVFLQHGVTQNDISRWLNRKPIAGFISATAPEYRAIAGDHSQFSFTSKEVCLSGFPRYDRLAKLGSGGKKNRILILPSWRQYLVDSSGNRGSSLRLLDGFMESEFARAWQELLKSSWLAEAAQRNGLDIVFMPHPNLEGYMDRFLMPSYVRVATYGSSDIQEELSSSALVVTDYSSIAFDAAFIERPVVYYQFDREKVFGGDHTTRVGYFDYERDGFGPVCEDVYSLETVIQELLQTPGEVPPSYLDRVRSTFTLPRHGACRRVTDFILSLDREVPRRHAVEAIRGSDVLNVHTMHSGA